MFSHHDRKQERLRNVLVPDLMIQSRAPSGLCNYSTLISPDLILLSVSSSNAFISSVTKSAVSGL